MTAPLEYRVHPHLARKVLDEVHHRLRRQSRFTQVYPGVFAHSKGEPALSVVIGAAPISDPAVRALRACGYLEQYLVIQHPEEVQVHGPRSAYDEPSWAVLVVEALGQSRDVNCVVSIFEIMHATTPLAITNLLSASALVAAHVPFDFEPVTNRPFLNELAMHVDAEMAKEAAS